MRRIVGLAGSAVAALALAACGTSSEEPSDTTPAEVLGPDRWIEDVYGADPAVTMGEMVLPGTHDSGSYGINVEQPCELVTTAGTADVITALAKVNPCAAAGMFRAQDEDLAAQLEAGVRYLDLRVSVPAKATGAEPEGATAGAPPAVTAEDFVLEHEFVSTPLTDALDDILTFAATRPKEQVILDFQHIDLDADLEATPYYDALATMLREYAPVNAVPVCERAWSADAVDATSQTLATAVTLQDAWDADRNLVVLVPDDTLTADPCYFPRNNAIMSQWPNTEDPAASLADNANQLAERRERLAAQPQQCSNGGQDANQGDNWCGFFVNQMQLTFQPATFARCIADTTEACSLFAFSQKVNNTVAEQVRTWAISDELPVNIVIVDYFNDAAPSYTEALIEVNRSLAAQRSAQS